MEVANRMVNCGELVPKYEADQSFYPSCNYGTLLQISHVLWEISKGNVSDAPDV